MQSFLGVNSDTRLKSNLFLILLIAGLGIYLFPILWGEYFVAGDGPTHVYNSRVLKDWLLGQHVDFYKQFYFENFRLDPNWMDHVLLSSLMVVFPPAIAEKLLLSLYVLGFGIGLIALVNQINRENVFIVFLGLPFIYHFTFFSGFWNCALSIALAIWVIRWWSSDITTFSNASVVKGLILITLLYFTHLIGLAMALMVMGGTFLMEYLENLQQKNPDIHKRLRKRLIIAVITTLPALLLVINFVYTKGLNQTQSTVDPLTLFDLYLSLTGLKSIGTDPYESIFVKIIAYTFHLLLIWGIVIKIKTRKISRHDGFFLAFLGVMYFYLNLPEAIVGGSVLVRRVQIVPYLILLGWLTHFRFPKRVVYGMTPILFVVSSGLVCSRLPAHYRSNQGVKEYLSVLPYIEPESTVLPLSYSHSGLDENGAPLSRMWLFMHAGDYLGAEKPLVMLSNYEASSGAFPFIYHYHLNPFVLIGTNEGIEFLPPSMDLMRFQKETGFHIDYIVTWCRNLSDPTHPYWIEADSQLNTYYDLIYTSDKGRVELFQLKPELLPN